MIKLDFSALNILGKMKMNKELFDDINRVAQEQFLGNKDAKLSVDTEDKILGDRVLFYHKKDGTCTMLQMYGFYKKEDIGVFHFNEDEDNSTSL